ncbi:MAG TPA: hypothetical protein VGM60_11145 [Pseudonocardia sp.]
MTSDEPDKPARSFDFTSAAECLAQWPEVCERLLACHVAGSDGRCSGCRLATQPAPPWPCTLHVLASMASGVRSRAARRRKRTRRGRHEP